MNQHDLFLQSLANFDRISQVSKVTSTPRTMSPEWVSSPSVSTIERDNSLMDVDSASELEASDSDLSSSHAVLKSVRWPAAWSSLRAKVKDSLYYKLMDQPKESESIAIDVTGIYQNNPRKGVVLILQFFVDLCGYKNVSLEKIYNFDKENSQAVIQRLETDLMDPELKKTGKFVFQKRSKFESQIERILAEFLRYLVTASFKTGVLFDQIFAAHLFQFVQCMAFSGYKNIRITGVIIVLKFLTASISLYNQLLSVTQDENSNNSRSVETTDKKNQIEHIIDFLYKIYEKNCLLATPQCYPMKVKCAHEMVYWIKLFPQVFIFKRKCLGRLIKLMSDENENVRIAALDTCAKLLANENLKEVMSLRVELCLKITSSRFNDVSYKVAAKAVNVFTTAINLYSEFIEQKDILSIINKMYFQNILLAKTSGKFLATYLKHKYNDIEILTSLAKTAHLKKQFSQQVPYFLESCVEFLPQLKKWQLIIEILVDEEVDYQTRKYLLTFFNETIKFTITGNFTKNRGVNFHAPNDSMRHIEIASEVLPHITNLILQFQNDTLCLTEIIQVLMFFDGQSMTNAPMHYTKILRLLKTFFTASKDEKLLGAISKTFSHFCKDQDDPAKVVIKSIIQDLVNVLKDDLNQISPSSEKRLLVRLRDTSMKVSILFESFDLTEVLCWTEIFDAWAEDTLKIFKYVIVCCKWYLIWNLRQYIITSIREENEDTHYLLYGNCKQFVYNCVDLLQNAPANRDSFLVFEIVCDFYTSFEKELIKKRKFSKFFIKITETAYRKSLVDFVVRNVIENNKLDLSLRQTYLSKFVDIVHLDVIPADHLSKILRYYHTHVEFGAIMEHILNELSRCNPGLPILVLHTLVEIYNEILKKYTVVNILSAEAKKLKLLAKKLASFKGIKSPNILLKLVHMVIYFSFKGEENFPFLYFGRYFAQLLNTDGKQDALKLFKKRVPKKHKNNDNILLFSQTLKSK